MTATDFDDVLNQVGSWGAYQKFILALVLFPATLPCAFISWNQLFMSGTSSTYHCTISGLANSTTANTSWFIPSSTDEYGAGQLDKCRMYNLNYSDQTVLLSGMGNVSATPVVPCKYG